MTVKNYSFIEEFLKLIFQNENEFYYFFNWLTNFFQNLRKSNIVTVLIGDSETTDFLVDSIIKPIFITPRWIKIKNYVSIRKGARIEGVGKYLGKEFNPSIILEDYVSIEQNIHITCANSIIISKNTAIASNVTITDIDHPYININLPPEKQDIIVGSVFISEDCKIYNNAVILPNVSLGKHSVVGANSVVLGKKYPDYCILVGAPAKIIKQKDAKTEEKTQIMEELRK